MDSQDSSRNQWKNEAFFGLHYDIHAEASDTDLGAALSNECLRAEIEKVRPDWLQCDCKGHPGYASWPSDVGSTAPGVINDALRIHRDVTREMGIPLVAHYSGVWDNRAIELHPDWARVNADGSLAGSTPGDFGSTCNLSPYTTDLMIPQMIEVIDKYDVDAFWVDGESWAVKPCYCDRCKEAFRAEKGVVEPPSSPDDPHWREWAAFHRKNFVEHVRKYADAVHAHKPACQVCSNWMYSFCQPEEIEAPVDFLSGDLCPLWAMDQAILETRSLDSRGLPWSLMAWGFLSVDGSEPWKFKPAAQLCQEAACVISLGGGFMIYDQPERNGHFIGWHQDTMADVARFVRARQPWCRNTESVPQVALLHSASSFYRNNREMIVGAHESNRAPITGALHALLENHYHVDVVTEPNLTRWIGSYEMVVVAEQTSLSDEFKSALARYVQGGGKVLLSGVNVATDFPELAGVEASGDVLDGHFCLQQGREATVFKGKWQPVRLKGARVLKYVMDEQDPEVNQTDVPAITINSLGSGHVLAIHSGLFSHFAAARYPRTRVLIGEALGELSVNRLVETDAPARVHIVLRRQPGRLIIHLVNTGTAHPTSPVQGVIEEVPTVGPVTLTAKCSHPPKRVYFAPSHEGLTWDWRDGLLRIRVESIGIMGSVVIEDGPGTSLE